VLFIVNPIGLDVYYTHTPPPPYTHYPLICIPLCDSVTFPPPHPTPCLCGGVHSRLALCSCVCLPVPDCCYYPTCVNVHVPIHPLLPNSVNIVLLLALLLCGLFPNSPIPLTFLCCTFIVFTLIICIWMRSDIVTVSVRFVYLLLLYYIVLGVLHCYYCGMDIWNPHTHTTTHTHPQFLLRLTLLVLMTIAFPLTPIYSRRVFHHTLPYPHDTTSTVYLCLTLDSLLIQLPSRKLPVMRTTFFLCSCDQYQTVDDLLTLT